MFKSLLGRRSRKDRPGSSSPAIVPNSGKSGKTSQHPDATPKRSDDPPPAYSITAPSPSGESIYTSEDDPYAFLSSFDTIFLVDDSGSMTGPSWHETEAALRAITPICTAHDPDGIDIYFLNHHSGFIPHRHSILNDKAPGGYYNITSPIGVHNLFRDVVRPAGATPTGARLHSILKPYLDRLASAKERDRVRPVNIIVITDGRPTDDPESVIKAAARRLDGMDALPHQVGIQFFQVGGNEGAREALRELDDEMAGEGVRDMVDAVTWDGDGEREGGRERMLSAEGILKVVLGAVIRRLDRKPAAVS